ncbi:LuxR C-terminal-related transcriptional regulator [Mycolicibacterium vaccae]|uniref:helix-turn-helix transcriptional regulator n=1 Tax=Mycolicibacterium vaccae TaxID=1810 RepID=UPI003D04604B
MGVSWPLVGRSDELRRIEAALSTPDVSGVVLSGAPGVGKSRLLAEARRKATARGYLTRVAVGTSSARAVPLGAFTSWAPPDASNTISLVRGVTASLCAAPPDAKVLVIVDDAHLLDELAMFVLHQIAMRRAATLLVSVVDDAPAPAPLQEIWKVGRFDHLALEPLSLQATAELAAAALQGPVAHETARRLWGLTRGNALYLRNILEQEVEEGRIVAQQGRWWWTGEPVLPPSLVALIETRFAELPRAVGDVLDVLAVGEPLALSALERLAEPDAVEDAETRGLVTVARGAVDPQVRLAHPIYGEVRRRRAPATKLRRLRGTVADALAAGTDRDEIPVLVRRAALLLESDAAADPGLMLRAAYGSVGLADLTLAARLAQAAIRAGAGVEASFVHSHVLSWLGRGAEADAALADVDARSLPDAQRARLAFLRSSNALWTLGDPGRAKAIADEAAATIAPEHRSYVDAFLTVYWFAMDRPDAVRHWDATEIDELPPIVGAETAWPVTTVHAAAGRTADAVRTAEAGYRAVARSADAPQMGFNIADSHLSALWLAGDIAGVGTIAERVRTQAADLPGVAQPLGTAIAGRAALARGDIGAAASLLDEAAAGLSAAEALGWGYRYGIPRAATLAMRGDTEDAAALLDSLTATKRPFRVLDDEISFASAWIAAGRGTVSVAVSTLLSAAERSRAAGRFAVEVLCLQAAVQFGDHSGAARLEELATLVEGPRAGLGARFAAALRDGDAAQMAALAEDFENIGDLVAALDAAAHAALAYRRQGRRGSALGCVSHADALAQRCGGISTPALAQANEPIPLTKREREIAMLLGRGMSNRGIAEQLTLSVRTVEGHIHRAMKRCGAETREELAALLQPKRKRNDPKNR